MRFAAEVQCGREAKQAESSRAPHARPASGRTAASRQQDVPE
ncbi:hypothetical protein BURPS668_A3237 [Burkholderia pseudomallei 668]|nr:hypothetical protein BURPS668_A3237 [Burkholderia pseudomallei 668]